MLGAEQLLGRDGQLCASKPFENQFCKIIEVLSYKNNCYILTFKASVFNSFFLPPTPKCLICFKEVEQEDDSSDDDAESSLPQDPDTCLQMNHVYQEVIQEKIEEVELLIAQNREEQVSGTGVKGSLLCFPGLPFTIFSCLSSPVKLLRAFLIPGSGVSCSSHSLLLIGWCSAQLAWPAPRVVFSPAVQPSVT